MDFCFPWVPVLVWKQRHLSSASVKTSLVSFFCVCSVDSKKRVVRINYNNATRDSVLDLPLDKVQPFYSSLKSFVELMNRPENLVTYRMEPGQSAGTERLMRPLFCCALFIDLKINIWHKVIAACFLDFFYIDLWMNNRFRIWLDSLCMACHISSLYRSNYVKSLSGAEAKT